MPLSNLLAQANFSKQMAEVLSFYVFPAVLSVSVLWAIYIGARLAVAKDEGARGKAKEQFVKAIASIFIIACLHGIMLMLNFTILDDSGQKYQLLINQEQKKEVTSGTTYSLDISGAPSGASLYWTLDSGTANTTLSSGGTFRAGNAGTVTVSVRITEPNKDPVFTSFTITIKSQAP